MRRSIRLESLEARDCPALTLQSLYGSLYIKGTPNGNLTITETAANTFTVQDGAATLGVYPVQANLHVTLSSRPGWLRVDLQNRTLNGNLLIDLGTGYTGPLAGPRDVSVYDGLAVGQLETGTIRGNVTVLRGDGRETVGIGALMSTNVNRPITVRGNLTAVALASRTFDDTFQLGDASVVRGSASVTHYDNVNIGDQDTTTTGQAAVLGNVNVTTAGVSGGLLSNFYGTFGRNITVNAAGATTTFNTFNIEPAEPDADTTVAGFLRVSQGQANVQNSFQVLPAVGDVGRVVVTGTTQLISTNNSGTLRDAFELGGEFSQTVTVQSANQGMDLTFPAEGVINGNLNVTAGNGVNNVGTQGANVFVGDLTGAFNFRGGAGTNRVGMQVGIGNVFTFVGTGNGDNIIRLQPTAPTQYNVDILFGSGDNTLTLNNNVTITGEVEAPMTAASNTYNQNGATELNLIKTFFP